MDIALKPGVVLPDKNSTSTEISNLNIQKEPPKRGSPFAKMVKTEDFENFKKSVEGTQNQILNILEGMSKKGNTDRNAVPAVPANDSTLAVKEAISEERSIFKEEEQGFMPQRYQKIFNEVFDPSDGFDGRLTFPDTNDSGEETGGIMFSIVVPEKFSNMTNAHKLMYKQDLRSIALKPNNVARGIAEWCTRVAKNIRYNKIIQTKPVAFSGNINAKSVGV